MNVPVEQKREIPKTPVQVVTEGRTVIRHELPKDQQEALTETFPDGTTKSGVYTQVMLPPGTCELWYSAPHNTLFLTGQNSPHQPSPSFIPVQYIASIRLGKQSQAFSEKANLSAANQCLSIITKEVSHFTSTY